MVEIPDASDGLTTSSRDPLVLGARFQNWLSAVLGDAANPVVSDVSTPSGNGMSSETLLLSVSTEPDGTEGAGRMVRRYVVRLEPEQDKCPVFPRYDLAMQARVMDVVARLTDAPVPTVAFHEPSSSPLGAPFLVMERVDGLVPPDILPYTFGDCWLSDATEDQLDRLEQSTVATLAAIHAVTIDSEDLNFLTPQPLIGPIQGETALERHFDWWDQYRRWATADRPSPILTAGFEWLADHRPHNHEARLSWGDSRIGNLLYVDHQVRAVLDWEMASAAPVEVDLGWLTYMHRFFQDMTEDMGMPGLPGLLTTSSVIGRYQAITGRPVDDLRWYQMYAAMRHGVIMRRVGERAVLHGQAQTPDDPDDLIIHRSTLEAMLAGTYWDRLPA